MVFLVLRKLVLSSHNRLVIIANHDLQYPIPPGGNFTYKFSTDTEYGFYWYHSHFRAYYDDAIRGPLLIRPSPSRRRPFESLVNDTTATKALLQGT